jgi:hypothetical protein
LSFASALLGFPNNFNAQLPNVGRITTLAAGTNPRQIQFGLRLMF